jgi:hypothetical protein
MTKIDRKLAMIVVFVLLAVSLLSFNFIIDNIHHACIGEECSICLQIEVIVKYFINLKSIIFIPFLMVILCVLTQLFYIIAETTFIIKKTLISFKVELLN